jgi:hypothetical protein
VPNLAHIAIFLIHKGEKKVNYEKLIVVGAVTSSAFHLLCVL